MKELVRMFTNVLRVMVYSTLGKEMEEYTVNSWLSASVLSVLPIIRKRFQKQKYTVK